MESINLGVDDGLPLVDWNATVERIADGSPPAPDAHNVRTTWLTTLNDDGSPHVTAVGALWLDDTFWFQTAGAGLTGDGRPNRIPAVRASPHHSTRRRRVRRRGMCTASSPARRSWSSASNPVA